MSASPFRISRTAIWLVLVAASALVGCQTKTPPTTVDIPPPSSVPLSGPKESGPSPVTGPVTTTTPEEFFQECEKDKKAAFQHYQNGVIEMTGTIAYLRPDDVLNYSVVALKVKGQAATVRCSFADPAPWTKVSIGQQVTIKGACPASEYELPSLGKCTFVNLQPMPTPALTAEQLAKEYAADKDATIKKYKDQLLVVTGEVVEKVKDKPGWLFLKGMDQIQVECSFAFTEEHQAKELKVGQQVKLLATFLEFEQHEKVVALRFCNVLK